MTEKKDTLESSEGETAKPADSTEPTRQGPPVQLAEEVLNPKGLETLAVVKNSIEKNLLSTGGREDLPWVSIPPSDITNFTQKCRDSSELMMDMLHCLFAVDYIDHIELNYILFSIKRDHKLIVKTKLDSENPVINTVTHLWQAAAWYERETHDLFGVVFTGNDDLAPLLLYEGFEGYPGLKSFPLHDYEEY